MYEREDDVYRMRGRESEECCYTLIVLAAAVRERGEVEETSNDREPATATQKSMESGEGELGEGWGRRANDVGGGETRSTDR